MKNFWSILFMLLISCVSTTDRPISPLLSADSLIQIGHVDSALTILEDITPSCLDTELSKAWYALLLTQAADEKCVTHTNDSLIRIAVDYFDSFGDVLQQDKAHYYWGRFFQDRDDIERAVREFLTAIPLAEKAKDYELNILLRSNLGFLCRENGLQEAADSLYKQVMELAEAHKDSLRLATSLVNRADIYIENGEGYYDIAEGYLKRALKLAENFENRYNKDIIYRSLGYLFEYQGKLQDAIFWANKGIGFDGDTLQRQGCYLVLGSAYAQSGQYDSARIYLNRCLYSENYYTIANAYMRLSEVAKALGDSDEALEYELKYVAYKDSIKLLERPVQLVSLFKDITYSQSLEHYKSYLILLRFALIVILLLLLFFVVSLLLKWKKKNERVVELVGNTKSLLCNIKDLEKELVEKEEQIKKMNWNYQNLEYDMQQKCQLESCMKELLEQQREMQNELNIQLQKKDLEVVRLRTLNLRSLLSSTPVCIKLCEICKSNKNSPDKIEKMTSEEWEILINEVDQVSMGFVRRLKKKYEWLLEDDLHFCCLVKLDFKYSEIAYIWGCTSVNVHKRSKSLLGKMKVNKGVKLIEVLNDV